MSGALLPSTIGAVSSAGSRVTTSGQRHLRVERRGMPRVPTDFPETGRPPLDWALGLWLRRLSTTTITRCIDAI